MQILNTRNSVLFKDNDYYPIPQFYFITTNMNADDIKDIIRNATNIREVTKELTRCKAEYNILRVDEVTHVGSHNMVY